MIQAIIFDCFGVLTSDGWLPFKKKHFSSNAEISQQATALSEQLNAGMIRNDEFVDKIANLAQVNRSEAVQAVQQNVPDEELFAYIATHLKPSYKLGILSNAGGNRLKQLFSVKQLALFDDAALSFETGFVKPDERAYEHMASALGVKPEECVFIDDQERHCTGAREVGMHTVVYSSFEQFKAELERILSDSKN